MALRLARTTSAAASTAACYLERNHECEAFAREALETLGPNPAPNDNRARTASGLVGLATWLSFWAVGLDHAAVWGVAAAVLNLVPYLGNLLITIGSALVGFLQFGTLEMALLVACISLVINGIEAFLLSPWLTSRASKMNALAIFVGVLAWGWLWGAWGLLLGVPILMVIKAICDRVDDLKPVGEFLGT